MKFHNYFKKIFTIKINIIILFTSFYCNTSSTWEKYLTDIDIKNEPIKEEWVTPCVKGYRDCGYKGASSFWCDGKYKFTVVNGVVKPDLSSYSESIKSLQIPKGYFVNIFGAFMKKYFSFNNNTNFSGNYNYNYTQVNLLNDGDNLVDKSFNTDEACTVQFSYWKMKMTVISSNYVKITKLMPNLISALIKAQYNIINRAQELKNLDKCMNEVISIKTSKSFINTQLTQLSNLKIQYESSIKILSEKIKNYQGLIAGISTSEKWIYNNRTSLRAFYEKLNNDNQNIEKKIKLLRISSEEIKLEIKNLISQRKAHESKLEKLKSEDSINSSKYLTESNKLKDIEVNQSSKLLKYSKLTQDTANLKSKRNAMEQQIKQLNERITHIDLDIKKNNCKIVLMEEGIGETINSHNQQINKIEEIKKSDLSVKSKITNTTNIINTLDSKINSFNNKISNIINEISSLTSKLKANANEIQKNNKPSSFISTNIKTGDIPFYKTEILKLQIEQSNMELKIKNLTEVINSSNSKIKTENSRLIIKSDCVNKHKQLVKEYTSQHSLNKDLIFKIYYEVREKYNQQLSHLTKAIDSISEHLTIEEFLSIVKRNLHEYLDSLPADPKIVTEIQNSIVRRRRLLRLKFI